MRITLEFSWRAAVRAVALLVGVGILCANLSPASAQAQRGGDQSYDDDVSGADHQSFIRIQDTGGPIRKSIKIGMGKSVLLEFPRPVRDVMVSNPAVVDAVVLSSNRVFLLAKDMGEANAFFFDTSGNQFATMELYVARETAGLESLLNRIITGARIKVEMLNQTVILTGSVKSPIDSTRAGDIAGQFISQQLHTFSASTKEGVSLAEGQTNQIKESVINMLTVEAEEQVMLKVTVAEVQRTLLKQMGVNVGAMVQSGSFATQLLTQNSFPITVAQGLGALPSVGIGTSASSGCTVGALCTINTGAGGSFQNSGVTSQFGSGNNAVQTAIRALERDGLIRTLAEPNLTAISGEPAEFLAGGEVPYVTGIDTQSGVSSVAFKKFGVQLSFTPVVLSEGRISLKIDTSVSDISQFIANNPVFDTRQAKTVVELPSGGSLALAGLISTKTQQNIDGLPGAKDIPILGTLFRSRDFQNQESELVVIVTPYVVQPVSRQQLATPADGLAPATDLKADFLGHLNRIYGKSEAMPSGGLKGDYGFIVE
ncbi:type II and III secretion system protein family protein [Hyphomicrobium sp. MC1]|uniref:type II and III secretion system protein family protein n=1 Tax=Hyphomicrobium sp. (strain MC1) TaxID=717785 RepID=UPI000213DCC9|nr:type II and III secretion system protein family protein [Hyphomicrobium sp. MC1]CCB63848.1 Type II and III secretion system protein [Hyphomicrobium sp. MC1]